MLPGGIVLETSCVRAPVKDLLKGMYLNLLFEWCSKIKIYKRHKCL